MQLSPTDVLFLADLLRDVYAEIDAIMDEYDYAPSGGILDKIEQAADLLGHPLTGE